ncbi:MAG: hypothetical protein B7Y51_10500 [Burkholderiales bacterium 28-67-8]|nr:MAG: hypothetical protein B7Y51_10500 [Burkholderiales bacterium 28-67-8]
MSRLQIEFRRLFLATDSACADGAVPTLDLVDADGRVRALVIELARPAEWQPLADVWMGVQTELGLPAPAIAVNGTDGMQLWFSVAAPLDAARAQSFLNGLRHRYLAAVKPERLGLMTGADSALAACATALSGSAGASHEANGRWPAFVAPDLAPIFAETPWLDLPPGDEGQARVLAGLESIKPALFEAALAQLQAWADAPTVNAAAAAAAAGSVTSEHDVQADGHPEAQRFLLSVMNDEAAPLALRIEAAKALLPFGRSGGRTI